MKGFDLGRYLMKKMLFIVPALLLSACASPQGAFIEAPAEYGLYVASTNIYFDTQIVFKSEKTGELIKARVEHPDHGAIGYLMASLPPGRYFIYSYSPNPNVSLDVMASNGYFDVQADCFNYGGELDFAVDDKGVPSYTDSSRIMDLEQFPSKYRKLARGRDICAATMGKPNERFAATDIAKLMSL
ncbi:MAG TPA: hypothetical protein VFK12_04310 [Gammaproteobacteria bacterium]|nr:hypothetical protein [Gammaproteobacteria bacterium]